MLLLHVLKVVWDDVVRVFPPRPTDLQGLQHPSIEPGPSTTPRPRDTRRPRCPQRSATWPLPSAAARAAPLCPCENTAPSPQPLQPLLRACSSPAARSGDPSRLGLEVVTSSCHAWVLLAGLVPCCAVRALRLCLQGASADAVRAAAAEFPSSKSPQHRDLKLPGALAHCYHHNPGRTLLHPMVTAVSSRPCVASALNDATRTDPAPQPRPWRPIRRH
jgi:hypothetical protein